jgi:hypothetical protein
MLHWSCLKRRALHPVIEIRRELLLAHAHPALPPESDAIAAELPAFDDGVHKGSAAFQAFGNVGNGEHDCTFINLAKHPAVDLGSSAGFMVI